MTGDIIYNVAQLKKDIKSRIRKVKLKGIEKLGECGDTEALELLKKELNSANKDDEELIFLLRKAIEKLSAKLNNQPKSDIDLTALALDHENPLRRIAALRSIPLTFDKKIVPYLIENLKNESHLNVIATYVKVIGQLGDESVIDELLPYLNHEDARIRANTIEGLEFIGGEKIIEHLIPKLVDKNSRVSANAAKALWKFKQEEVIAVLKNMLRSDKPWKISSAIFALSEIGSAEAIKLLENLSNHENEDIKLSAKEALKKVKSHYYPELNKEFFKFLGIVSSILFVTAFVVGYILFGRGKSRTIAETIKSNATGEISNPASNKQLEKDIKLANQYFKDGDFELAIPYLLNILKVRPDDINVRNNLAFAYEQLDKNEEAIKEYKKVIKYNPSFFKAYNNIGFIYQKNGDLKNAIKYFKKAVEINPEYSNGYNNLGFAYFKLGNIEEAIKNYKKAIKIDPKSATALNNLGYAYYVNGKVSDSIKYYKKAIEIKPDYKLAYNNLAISYIRKGQFKKAIVTLNKLIELDPSSPMAEEADRAITLLKKKLNLQ